MKRITTITLFFLVLILVACGSQEPDPTATPEPATAVPPTAEPAEEPAPEPTAEITEIEVEAEMLDLGALTEHPWQWVSFTSPVEQFDVETPDRYRVLFNPDGTVQIVADCNNVAGEHTEDAGTLTITIGPSTLAACLPDSRSDQFITYLSSAAIAFFEEGNLYIDLMADGGTMAFAPSENDNMVAEGEGDVSGPLLPYVEPLDECFSQPAENIEVAIDYECGYVVVPEFYHQDSTRELKVPYIRFNSGKGTAVSPILVHPGGPGASQLDPSVYVIMTRMFSDVVADRDVIFIDPRGTKLTDTFLDCPAVYSLSWEVYSQKLDAETASALTEDTLQQCIDDFRAQGINFDAYNSLELAGDVNAVRQALGYDQIIYYGASYGSQLGQHVMREYPDILEMVILDGANALSRQSWVEDRGLDIEFGMTNLAERCAADAKCIEAYPDILGLVDQTLQILAEGNLPYAIPSTDDPELVIEGDVSLEDMVNFLYGYQSDKNNVFVIPYLLTNFVQPETRQMIVDTIGQHEATRILGSRDQTAGGLAYLMHLAVVCSDDPVKSLDDIILDGVGELGTIFAQSGAKDYISGCAQINVTELPDSTDENVTAVIPTLILSGDLDVATPAFRSQIIADALPNATHVIFPGHTHVQLGQFNECAVNVYTQFITNPAGELDTSCLAEVNVLGFLLPDGTFSVEAEP